MLPQAETLETIAEISAALAGFAALAGAVGNKQGQESPRASFERLRYVVLQALYLLMFAILPLVVADYRLPPTSVWQASSAAALLVNVAIAVPMFRNVSKVGLHRGWLTYLIIYPLEAIANAALIANTFALLPDYAGPLYLTFLFAALAQTTVAFVWLLDAAFTPNVE